jgi:hypothetical protein
MKASPDPDLGCDGPPLGHRGRASQFLDFPADEIAQQIEVVVDLAVDGGEFLERLRLREFEHRRFSSPNRLIAILGSIALQLAHFPAFEVACLPHRVAGHQGPIWRVSFACPEICQLLAF